MGFDNPHSLLFETLYTSSSLTPVSFTFSLTFSLSIYTGDYLGQHSPLFRALLATTTSSLCEQTLFTNFAFRFI